MVLRNCWATIGEVGNAEILENVTAFGIAASMAGAGLERDLVAAV